jgi:hypothetical protein
MMMHSRASCVLPFLLALGMPAAGGAQTAHPRDFTTLQEETSDGTLRSVPGAGLKAEIDKTSDILVQFDRKKVLATAQALPKDSKIEIRVEASITRAGATQNSPLPIDNYYILVRDKSGTVTDVTIVDQAIINNGTEVSGFLPDAVIDLTSQALATGDQIRVRVSNLSTQESIDKLLTVRDFGVIGDVKDSFFFLSRLGVSAKDPVEGVDNVNFGPAPGVTYLWTVSTRKNNFLRALRPSVGINVSFTDWDDPAFNQATGQFAAGTNASDIEITSGIVGGVFDGLVQFTLGWNLNVEQKRKYFGVGFSFVNIVDRLGKLIAKK